MHNLFILCPVQKAGFMLVEVSFATTPEERRNVVIIVRVGAKQREYKQLYIKCVTLIYNVQNRIFKVSSLCCSTTAQVKIHLVLVSLLVVNLYLTYCLSTKTIKTKCTSVSVQTCTSKWPISHLYLHI